MNAVHFHPKEVAELKALVSLLDDPEPVVAESVQLRLNEYGTTAIPHLEYHWEQTNDAVLQERITTLIHQLQFQHLIQDLREWKENPYHDLLFGNLLIGRYFYPELQTAPVIQQLERIKRSIWLELNSFLTPLEQIHIFVRMLHGGFGLKSEDLSTGNADAFLLHKALETRKGNLFSNAGLYLILAELLDLPLRVVNVPRQFLLAYYHTDPTRTNTYREAISFFIDPAGGQLFGNEHIDGYFRKINVPVVNSYFRPLHNTEVLQQLTEQLSRCFAAGPYPYKQDDLLEISRIISS